MIKTQDFEIYPEFGRNAQKRQPDNVRYSNGFVPADVLPAEWVNWAWAKNSRGISELNRGLEIVEAELNAILDSGGILPDETTEIKTQVIQAIKNVILQYTGTLTNLNTVHKDTIVQAVNEILSALRTHENRSDNPHGVTKAQVGLGNVPNVQTNDQTPTFSAASSLQPLNSGEKISSLFSKLARAVSEFISHKANRNNPHGVTKAQVGLGNVDNTPDREKKVKHAETADRVIDYGDTSSTIKIGYAGSSLEANQIEFLAGYTSINGGWVIKDINKETTKRWLELDNVDNTPDREKEVKYAHVGWYVYGWGEHGAPLCTLRPTLPYGTQNCIRFNIKEKGYSIPVDSSKHAETADRVIDYGDTSSTIKIGYAGSPLELYQIDYLAGYTYINSERVIKNITKETAKKWLEIGNVDNTPDREKKVKHAETADRVIDFGDPSSTIKIGYAGSSLGANQITQLAGYTYINGERVIKDINKETAKKWLGADKVNADTVDGFHAGNSAGMLIPVTAFSSGNSSGYIKLGNGLIVQWGKAVGDETDVVLPVAYSKYYSISLSVNAHSGAKDWSRTGTYERKTFNGFHISVCLNSRDVVSDWITIGF